MERFILIKGFESDPCSIVGVGHEYREYVRKWRADEYKRLGVEIVKQFRDVVVEMVSDVSMLVSVPRKEAKEIMDRFDCFLVHVDALISLIK